jgi:hypothetical protein
MLARVDRDNGVHGGIEDAAQTGLALCEHGLGMDAIGDIAQDHRVEPPAPFAVLGDRRFD